MQRILLHSRYGKQPHEIEFLCRFSATEELWLSVKELAGCAELVDEYWTNLDLDTFVMNEVAAPTEMDDPAEMDDPTKVAAPAHSKKENHRLRPDGNLRTSSGPLSQNKRPARMLTDFCDTLTESISSDAHKALRNWFFKSLNTVGIVAVRADTEVGIVTTNLLLSGGIRWESERPHGRLGPAALSVFHLRPFLLRFCARVSVRTNNEVIFAEHR